MSYFLYTGSSYFNFINLMDLYDALLVINQIQFPLDQRCPL